MPLPLYARIAQQEIEVFAHDNIQGEPVPTNESPFASGATSLFRLIGNENADQTAEDDDNTGLVRISDLHGRSYALAQTVYWRDRYGNLFSHLNSKGSNCTSPAFFKTQLTPSGFAVFGLQDSHALVRMLRASRVLREQNVQTELMVRVLEPASLPLQGENLSVPAFKVRLVENLTRSDGKKNKPGGYEAPSLHDVPALVEAVRTMIFFITIRGVQVNERIADLMHAKTDEERLRMLEPAFRFVNEEERMTASRQGLPAPTPFSIESDGDVDHFLHTILPAHAAQNLAGMHRTGLWHVYPHSGNISLVGSIYDLDSVQGKPLDLGDAPLTSDLQWEDVAHFLNDLQSSGEGGRAAFHAQRFSQEFIAAYFSRYFGYDPSIASALSAAIGVGSYERVDFLTAEFIADVYLGLVQPRLGAIRTAISEYGGDNLSAERTALYLQQILSRTIYGESAMSGDDLEGMIEQFAREIAQQLTGAIVPELQSLRDLPPSPLLRRVVEVMGYEENIVENATNIADIFSDFEGTESRSAFNHYFTRVCAQLDWEPHLELTITEVIETFHRADDQNIRTHVAKAVRETEPDQQSAAALVAVDSFDYIRDPVARLCGFILDLVKEKFDASIELAAILGRVRTDYGSSTEEKIRRWIEDYFLHVYHDDLPAEVQEEIACTADARVAQLRSTFTSSTISIASDPPDLKNLGAA